MGNAVSYCEPEEEEQVTEEPEQQDSPEAEGEEEAEKEQGDEEEEDEPKPEIVVRTAPYDARFPSTNQARNCYTRYNEFYRCAADKGEDDEECKFFRRSYRSLCPGEWVERWNEQRDEGTWPGKY